MEDEVEGVLVLTQAELLLCNLLALKQDLWAQLHVAWLVDAVNVAEGSGQHVAALLTGAQGIDGLFKVLRGGVQVSACLCLNTVLFAADDANLSLEDDVSVLSLFQQFLCDDQVLVDWNSGAVPHVGLEQRVLAAVDALLGDSQQRADVLIEYLLLAVVGVQRDIDAVVLRGLMSECGQCLSTLDLVLQCQAGTEGCAAGRELDDAVGLGLRKALQSCVNGLRRGAVDSWEREAILLRGIQHLVIDLRGCNWHEFPSLKVGLWSNTFQHPSMPVSRNFCRKNSVTFSTHLCAPHNWPAPADYLDRCRVTRAQASISIHPESCTDKSRSSTRMMPTFSLMVRRPKP